MTPEQKIITIAEFEGWKRVGKNKKWICPSGGWEYVQTLPPYLTSRDAICAAVARLDDERKSKLANYLYDIYLGFSKDEKFHTKNLSMKAEVLTHILVLPAEKIADALLLTLGHEV